MRGVAALGLKSPMQRAPWSGVPNCGRFAAVVCLALVGAPAGAQSDASAVGQSVGPDALSETWQAWTVTCGPPALDPPITRDCRMGQDLRRETDGQRILALTVRMGGKGVALATLVAPFGLDLARGVGLAVDDGSPATVPFRTCLPSGCIARLTLDTATASAMRAGQTATVTMYPLDAAEPITVTLPLDGFADAMVRLEDLN